jgi:hypothetical protein
VALHGATFFIIFPPPFAFQPPATPAPFGEDREMYAFFAEAKIDTKWFFSKRNIISLI